MCRVTVISVSDHWDIKRVLHAKDKSNSKIAEYDTYIRLESRWAAVTAAEWSHVVTVAKRDVEHHWWPSWQRLQGGRGGWGGGQGGMTQWPGQGAEAPTKQGRLRSSHRTAWHSIKRQRNRFKKSNVRTFVAAFQGTYDESKLFLVVAIVINSPQKKVALFLGLILKGHWYILTNKNSKIYTTIKLSK